MDEVMTFRISGEEPSLTAIMSMELLSISAQLLPLLQWH
jgi:hypothetical protein